MTLRLSEETIAALRKQRCAAALPWSPDEAAPRYLDWLLDEITALATMSPAQRRVRLASFRDAAEARLNQVYTIAIDKGYSLARADDERLRSLREALDLARAESDYERALRGFRRSLLRSALNRTPA